MLIKKTPNIKKPRSKRSRKRLNKSYKRYVIAFKWTNAFDINCLERNVI